MLDHQARKDSTYDETAQVFGELARLAPIIDATRFVSSGAILYSDEIGWAWNEVVSTRLRPILEYTDVSDQGRLTRWYRALYAAKIPVDIVAPLRDLASYAVVMVPNLYLVNEAIVACLEAYVRRGGWLLVGPKAALKDWSNVFLTDVPPGAGLAHLFGVTVRRSAYRMGYGGAPTMAVTMSDDAPFAAGMSFQNTALFDELELAGAQSVARFASGATAIALNRYGAGVAMYVGCEPEESFYRYLVQWLIAEGKVEPPLVTDADVEITRRAGGGHDLIFVLNHNMSPQQIQLDACYRELISETQVSGLLVIEGQGVRILERL